MVPPAVPVPASSWAPVANVSAAEHPEVFIRPAATVTSLIGFLAFTIAAPSVPPPVSAPPPLVPLAITKAYELLGTCRAVGVTEHIGVVKALTAAQSWVPQSSRYESLGRKNQLVRKAGYCA